MRHKPLKYYYPTASETESAISRLTDTYFSAAHRAVIPIWILTFSFSLCLFAAILVFYDYHTRLIILSLASVIVFICPVFLKWIMIGMALLDRKTNKINYTIICNQELPIYTVLVPLYKEGRIFPQLKKYLEGIDYPAEKLDIILLLEEDDHHTKKIVQKHLRRSNPYHIKQLIAPASEPRTKPKALNLALDYIQGEFFVIFDAEDRPEPDQLKKAASYFRVLPDHIGALQAKLSFYNSKQSLFLTRMFTLEYEVLFNHFLPGLVELGLPIPLSGTSTHMRTRDIKKIEGWDAFNVTEDCDLGIRLYAHGYQTKILDSVTYEEAVHKLPIWIRQRTRWMKGYLQTFISYFKHPIYTYKIFGFYHLWGIYTVVGGQVFGALLYPACWIFYLVSLIDFVPMAVIDHKIYMLGLYAMMFTGFILPTLQAALTSFITKKHYNLIFFSMGHCIYWFFAGIAAHRALWQLLTNPFKWEKTPHG